MRRKWPLLASMLCVGLVATTAFMPAGNIGLRQTSESENHRSREYGAFGVTFFQTNEPITGLKVGNDFIAALAKTGIKAPAAITALASKASRAIRPDGTQYWLRVDLDKDPKPIATTIEKQLGTARRRSVHSTGFEFEGLCPDGSTRLRFYAAKTTSPTDCLLTFGPGS